MIRSFTKYFFEEQMQTLGFKIFTQFSSLFWTSYSNNNYYTLSYEYFFYIDHLLNTYVAILN